MCLYYLIKLPNYTHIWREKGGSKCLGEINHFYITFKNLLYLSKSTISC